MNKLSLVMPIYNEDDILDESLTSILPFVDEAIIIDGSPDGPSTDNSRKIISKHEALNPGKIVYLSGIYKNEDGSWGEYQQKNEALSKVTSEYVILHGADIIYRSQDLEKIRDIIVQYPERQIIYFQMLEFWLNTRNIRLRAMDEFFCFPEIGILSIFSMDTAPQYGRTIGELALHRKDIENSIYVPNIFRYHYGWMGFERQIKKHLRNVLCGYWGDSMEQYRKGPRENLVLWAIRHVMDYPQYRFFHPYNGPVPEVMKDRDVSYLDGYSVTIKKYSERYNTDFEAAIENGKQHIP